MAEMTRKITAALDAAQCSGVLSCAVHRRRATGPRGSTARRRCVCGQWGTVISMTAWPSMQATASMPAPSKVE